MPQESTPQLPNYHHGISLLGGWLPILVEVTAPRAGPPTGKPVQVQIGALNPEVLPEVAKKVAWDNGAGLFGVK